MKITNGPTFINFSELEAGDVFYLDGFGIYMKTKTKDTCNAVDLSNGEFIECGDCCKVQGINCELIVKGG